MGDEIKLIVATASDQANKVYFQESNRLVQDFEENNLCNWYRFNDLMKVRYLLE